MGEDTKYEWGRGARLRCARAYLGLEQEQFAQVLSMSARSLQRMENGQAAIPSGVWGSVEAVCAAFDARVEELIAGVEAGDLRVRVWRGRSVEAPVPVEMWLRIVGEAMREAPALEPVFPEDDEPA